MNFSGSLHVVRDICELVVSLYLGFHRNIGECRYQVSVWGRAWFNVLFGLKVRA